MEDQVACLKEWALLLYGVDAERFDSLSKEVREYNRRGILKFYEENPGGHISELFWYELLPEKFDSEFGPIRPEPIE